MKTIHPSKLREIASPFVLDVRTPLEHGEMNLPGAVLHPLHQLDPGEVKSLCKGGTCYVLCRSGKRAEAAAGQLEAAGLKDVVVIEGGILACEQAGLPVNKGAAVMSLERQGRLAVGLFVLIGGLLAVFLNPAWVWVCVFFGAGLAFAAITDFCLLGMLLARMPWNNAIVPDPKAVTSCCTK